MSAPTPLTRCSFYKRTPVEGAFRYDAIGVRGWRGDGCLYTAHPPLPGDLIDFWDDDEHVQYRVIERAWGYSEYGSPNWPHGQPVSSSGPSVDIVVEVAEGLFRDEAPGWDEQPGPGSGA